MKQTVSFKLQGKEITLESGEMAKQTSGSVIAKCGDNVVLVTAVSSTRPNDKDFFPLTVEYAERFYSTGRIPGGYFKREGRPTGDAILNCRLIDRPLRPCFPEGYNQETQLIATIMSYDGQYPLISLASIAASAAFHISDVPFNGPICSLAVGRIDGEFVVNPNMDDLEKSDMDVIVSGTKNGILMVEGETKFVSEADVLGAIKFAHTAWQPVLEAQEELRKKMGSTPKREFTSPEVDANFKNEVDGFLRDKLKSALSIQQKIERYGAMDAALKEAKEKFVEIIEDKDEKAARSADLSTIFGDIKYEEARGMVLNTKKRIDGRDTSTVRPISTKVGFLPRAHGSALFTRGETQVLGAVTLGTGDDEQRIDALQGSITRKFLLHYNFPPYSVGEAGRFGGQSRREIGHGNLAERALKAVLPSFEDFPYVIRIVGEVLESNGSSSMGTVCAGTMAMLDAGVPIKGNVAGIAMGLITDGDKYAVLSDILGDEDHLGDMDFKVAGTREGITSLQMDIKIDSISFQIMEEALAQALEGRTHILDEMEKTIKDKAEKISDYAPRIETIKIKPEKVREVIGSGGKVIRSIVERTGVKIDIEDDGTIHVASSDPTKTAEAIQIINDICAEAEVGKVYHGKVVKVVDFGAFVEILPNNSGLLHISEIAHERVRAVTDVLNEGDELDVKVLDVDRGGKIKLSRKALLDPPAN